jgi:hypothetical protein
MYYAQYDLLEKLSKGKTWSFAEVRPDGVVSSIPYLPPPLFVHVSNTTSNSLASFPPTML